MGVGLGEGREAGSVGEEEAHVREGRGRRTAKGERGREKGKRKGTRTFPKSKINAVPF